MSSFVRGGYVMGLMDGKRGVIYGVANKNSIAWAIAQSLDAEGAQMALAYQNERFEKNVTALAGQLRHEPLLLTCDVTDDGQIEAVYNRLAGQWGSLDFIVHSIAHAKEEDLRGRFVDTSRAGFSYALEVSAYSLIAVTRPAVPLMSAGGSIVTLSYIASERVFPSYNVMAIAKAALENIVRYLAFELGPHNIRVNTISAGPKNTLAARGVPGFRQFLEHTRETSPLRRAITDEDLGHAAVYLLSDYSAAVTGETLFVDAGYHILGA
jgi:enoyl-[acyl-carrier protein] reductase I